jgi:hypothetical protein
LINDLFFWKEAIFRRIVTNIMGTLSMWVYSYLFGRGGSMSDDSEPSIWQVLGAIAGIGAIAFIHHKLSEAQIDALFEKSEGEAAREIIDYALTSDEFIWNDFRLRLQSRSYNYSRAQPYWEFAGQVRVIRNQLDNTLTSSPQEMLDQFVRWATVLDDATYEIYVYMINKLAENSPKRQEILHLFRRTRSMASEVNQLVDMGPSVTAYLPDILNGMQRYEVYLFRELLQVRVAETPTMAARLLLGQTNRLLNV